MVARSMSETNEIRNLIVRYGEKLTDDELISMLSEIYPKEDVKFANLLLIDEFTGVGAISLWVKTILTLRVSKGRKGRKEMIETIKGLMAKEDDKGKVGKTSMAIKKALLGESE